jgi:hypothetical protein
MRRIALALIMFFTAGVFVAAGLLYEELIILGNTGLTIPLEALLGFFVFGMILSWYFSARRGVIVDSSLAAS